MKQQITFEQIKEYIEWTIDNGICIVNHEKVQKLNALVRIDSSRNIPYPEFFTIGAMIEVLLETVCEPNGDGSISKELILDCEGYSEPKWCVSINNYDWYFEAQELCDALWEAVKEVLK